MCRHLYEPDGRFTQHHLQDWQHSAMYAAVMISGLVDLLGHYTRFLPQGTEQVRRTLKFESTTKVLAKACYSTTASHSVAPRLPDQCPPVASVCYKGKVLPFYIPAPSGS